MIEKGVEPDIILGRVQRNMGGMNIYNQGASSSRKKEDFKPRATQNQRKEEYFLREPYLT